MKHWSEHDCQLFGLFRHAHKFCGPKIAEILALPTDATEVRFLLPVFKSKNSGIPQMTIGLSDKLIPYENDQIIILSN